MKEIVIVGAGGFGREIFNYLEDCIKSGADWKIKGFIDDNLNALKDYDYPLGIISSIKDYKPAENEYCVMALGLPVPKKKVAEILKSKGAKFVSLIHPTANVGRNVEMGEGCVLCPRTTLNCDIKLGEFVTLNAVTGCGHDAQIGSYTTLSSYCDVTGFCKVGEGVFFGSHVCMRPSSKVGNWATVGIGAVVVMNVKDNTTVFGNPAVKIS